VENAAGTTGGGFGALAPKEQVEAGIRESFLGWTQPRQGYYSLDSAKSNYTIYFSPGQTPPIKPAGFWSITMYDKDGYLVGNPINRYNIGGRTPGLKYNTDGSLDIYISLKNPGPTKESNWFLRLMDHLAYFCACTSRKICS
jgi:hypothetical protein